jgi:hypothetical protein
LFRERLVEIIRVNIPINILGKSLIYNLVCPAFKPQLNHIKFRFNFEVGERVPLKEVNMLRKLVPLLDNVSEVSVRLTTNIWQILNLGFRDTVDAHRVWALVVYPDEATLSGGETSI